MPVMVGGGSPPNKKPTSSDAEKKQVPVPVAIIGGLLVLGFFLFMYHNFVSPLYSSAPPKMEKVPPPPGYPDVPPYNTKEWQQSKTKAAKMPGIPPIDYSKQKGPAPSGN